MEPDGIFVGGAARISCNPPPGFDRPRIVDEREDDIGVSGIDGEQHVRALARRTGIGEGHITGMNAFDPPVVEPQPERAVGVEAVEAARQAIAGRAVDGDRSADRVGAVLPGCTLGFTNLR